VNCINGHQDKNTTDFARLIINWDADVYEYLKDATINFTMTPIMSTSGYQLHLPHEMITHDIKRERKLARPMPPLKQKLISRNGRCKKEVEDIEGMTGTGRPWSNTPMTLSPSVKGSNCANKNIHRWPSCPGPLKTETAFWNRPASRSRNEWRK
jgi:hypothetical protein